MRTFLRPTFENIYCCKAFIGLERQAAAILRGDRILSVFKSFAPLVSRPLTALHDQGLTMLAVSFSQVWGHGLRKDWMVQARQLNPFLATL